MCDGVYGAATFINWNIDELVPALTLGFPFLVFLFGIRKRVMQCSIFPDNIPGSIAILRVCPLIARLLSYNPKCCYCNDGQRRTNGTRTFDLVYGNRLFRFVVM
jgi:hypothetical protein